MRLAWVTDIHLDFVSDSEARALFRSIAKGRPDALAISGDIANAHRLEDALKLAAEEVGVPVYFVLGNHDFYYGSIAAVRERMATLTRADPRIQWLPACGVVALGAGHALVGHDGWGDARHGDPIDSPIELNDWLLIEDLAGLSRAGRIARLNALGDEAAAALREPLRLALSQFPNVFVVTHVPPFREVCRYWGLICSDAWLPWLTCRAIGDLLLEAADQHPSSQITVLCGHSHGAAIARPRTNLIAYAGAARYGRPRLSRMFTRRDQKLLSSD